LAKHEAIKRTPIKREVTIVNAKFSKDPPRKAFCMALPVNNRQNQTENRPWIVQLLLYAQFRLFGWTLHHCFRQQPGKGESPADKGFEACRWVLLIYTNTYMFP